MCGIFGHVGPLDKHRAIDCLNLLAHRGPDDSGILNTPDVTLGHRRLAIIDTTESGHQPMSYLGGRFWGVFNGEIYNFIELREELSGKGHTFHSNSDTEVLLASFAEWGEQCLDRFNGMWALAIWDTSRKSLFLARDRFGKKPLFYARVSDGFVFASEMKAIMPLLKRICPNIDLIRDASRLFTYESTDECLIDGIRRFPAGHYGWLKEGLLSLRRWWNTLDHIPKVSGRYEEQCEEFRSLLLDSCRLRMRSDVPLATALSGGLDSSSISAAVCSITKGASMPKPDFRRQNTFVATFPGTPLDETKYADRVSSYLDLNTTHVAVDPLKGLSRLSEYMYLFEEIYLTSPVPFMQTYEQVRANGIKVSLDGHGADELFGGYTFDFIHALTDAKFDIAAVRMIVSAYYDSQPQDSSQFSLPPKAVFLLRWYLRQLLSNRCFSAETVGKDAAHPRWRELDSLGKVLYRSTHETILPTLLRNYDRYSMANGVEIRMPFLDHRLVSFAFALPWRSKMRGGFSKAIVRDAMTRYLPTEIAYRKTKIGFNTPIVDWMRGPLKPFILDTVSSVEFKTCQLIDAPTVSAKLLDVVKGERVSFAQGEQAWTLLTPFLWEQSFALGGGRPA